MYGNGQHVWDFSINDVVVVGDAFDWTGYSVWATTHMVHKNAPDHTVNGHRIGGKQPFCRPSLSLDKVREMVKNGELKPSCTVEQHVERNLNRLPKDHPHIVKYGDHYRSLLKKDDKSMDAIKKPRALNPLRATKTITVTKQVRVCAKCGSERFGSPYKSIDSKWKCKDCGQWHRAEF